MGGRVVHGSPPGMGIIKAIVVMRQHARYPFEQNDGKAATPALRSERPHQRGRRGGYPVDRTGSTELAE